MKLTLERFKLALSHFKRDDFDVVIGSAKRCLNTVDGEILLKHLVTEYNLDDPDGCLSADELSYRNATRDVVKYILSLTNDK